MNYYAFTKNAAVGDGLGLAANDEAAAKLPARSIVAGMMLAPMAAPASMPSLPPLEQPQAAEPAVQVRTDFRATVFWQPDVLTGPDGMATVKVKYPDSLTSWKATARAVTAGNQFGIAETNTHTRQPLIVRLEGPRFFVVGDRVVISAVMNNNTDDPMTARAQLEAAGLEITGYLKDGQPVSGEPASVTVPAHGGAREDWLAQVRNPGQAKLKVTARAAHYADAMEKSFPVYEHGIQKFVSRSGKARNTDFSLSIDLPAARKAESTSFTVQVTPSLAVTMLDALPYLIDYPYGCTEQTMSRFLPAAITAKTLRDLGLKPEDVMNRMFGGIEAGTAAATHPYGKRDLDQLGDIIQHSLDRLYDFQHEDGGWGWWKDDTSDPFMTAYVVWGLTLAQEAGVDVRAGVLHRGTAYLDKRLVDAEKDYDRQAWILHALAANHARAHATQISKFQLRAFDNLWKNRAELGAYGRALLALAAHDYGRDKEAKILLANLADLARVDKSPDASPLVPGSGAGTNAPAPFGTAHWGADGLWWRWSESPEETTAFVLRALLAIDPQNHLVEPTCNWLIKNRRGAQWSNTRDTAIAVLALNNYLRATHELASDVEYTVAVNGTTIATNHVAGAAVLNAPSRFAVPVGLLRDGANTVRITRRGEGSLYYSASAQYFSLEEPVPAAGNEIFVQRQYYKLVGRPTLLKGLVYDREPLNDGGTVRSGERVEVVLTVESKNNYEYLLFEDLKPAGLEAVEVRSGESLYAHELKSSAVRREFQQKPANPRAPGSRPANGHRRILSSEAGDPPPGLQPVNEEDFTGRTEWVYQELRDRKVALFLDHLPQGVWQIQYDLRAEVPGTFHALPVLGQAMYVPEIRCNGAETRLEVQEEK